MGRGPMIWATRRCLIAFVLARSVKANKHFHPTLFQLNLHHRARAARADHEPHQMKQALAQAWGVEPHRARRAREKQTCTPADSATGSRSPTASSTARRSSSRSPLPRLAGVK